MIKNKVECSNMAFQSLRLLVHGKIINKYKKEENKYMTFFYKVLKKQYGHLNC